MALEFRKEALTKLSSPDDLDRLMPVTDSRGWIVLLASGILLVAVIIWGFFGSVPVTISGEGITMMTGTIDAIFLRTNGVLRQFTVRGGDIVQSGQVIGVVEHPELKESVENARSETEFVSQHQQERKAYLQKELISLTERVERLNALLKEGLVETIMVSNARQELMRVKEQLYAAEDKNAAVERRYKSAQYNYQWQTVLTSPYTGKVLWNS